jgi:hypothetical protein
MGSVRVWLAILVSGTALLAFLAWRWYEAHVRYCKDSPEVAAGGDALSCMEPPHWMAFNLALGFLALVELTLVVATTFTIAHIRRRRREALRAVRN